MSGDVGLEITPGKGKLIVWEVKKELIDYKGEIKVSIRGDITPPFLIIISPQIDQLFRRGKKGVIEWTSTTSAQIKLKLLMKLAVL